MIIPVTRKIRKQVGCNSVTIGILGDISMHNIENISPSLFDPLRNAFTGVDLLIANVETVISDKALKPFKGKGILLKSPRKLACVLKEIGVDIALLANNHIDDFGLEGINDTVDALKEQNIQFFGLRERERLIVARNGLSFDLQGYVTPYENQFFLSSYGPNLDSINICLRENNSHLLYFLHGFDELYSTPFPWRVELLKKIVDVNKPSVLIAGHQHIYQGYYDYKNALIGLSYGNGFMQIDYHKLENIDSQIGGYSVLHFDELGCFQIDEYFYKLGINGVCELAKEDLNCVIQRIKKGIDSLDDIRQNKSLWEDECYIRNIVHPYDKNILINLMYDVYRFFKKRKSFRYIHYRSIYTNYIKKKWGVNLLSFFR